MEKPKFFDIEDQDQALVYCREHCPVRKVSFFLY